MSHAVFNSWRYVASHLWQEFNCLEVANFGNFWQPKVTNFGNFWQRKFSYQPQQILANYTKKAKVTEGWILKLPSRYQQKNKTK